MALHTKVEEYGVWPEGSLDAFFAMIPKTDGDATPGPVASQCSSLWCTIFEFVLGWSSWRIDFSLWSQTRSLVLVVVVVLLRRGTPTALDIEEVLKSFDIHLLVADVIKSFDTVDRGILDKVLSSFGASCLVQTYLLRVSCTC